MFLHKGNMQGDRHTAYGTHTTSPGEAQRDKKQNSKRSTRNICFGENEDIGDGYIEGPEADCTGICFGEAFLDDCDICSGGTSGHISNDDQDACMVCFGDNIDYDGFIVGSDADCNGDCDGNAYLNLCGTCVHAGTGLTDTNNIDMSNFGFDCGTYPVWPCGSVNNEGALGMDCFGTCFGNGWVDGCGNCVPQGDTSCLDCDDVNACKE